MHKQIGLNLEIAIIFSLVIVDQYSKVWVEQNLPWQESVDFLPGFLSLFYTRNTGMAFSLFNQYSVHIAILSCVSLVFLVFLYKLLTNGLLSYRVSWALIIAGAIGNLLSRLFVGSVVDFFSFDFISFPVFNIADIAITCGGLLYALTTLRIEFTQGRKAKEDEQTSC